MLRTLAALALLTGLLAVAPTAAGAGPPLCSASPCLVEDEATFVQALSELSASGVGVSRIELTDNIPLGAGTDPTYAGVTPLIIDGAGFELNGLLQSRILESTTAASVAFEDITILNGVSTTGRGPVEIDGELNINRATIKDNETTGAGSVFGGAIFGGSFVSVFDSTVTNNSATSTAGNADGGAIHGANTVHIEDSTVRGNTAETTSGAASGGAAHSNVKVEIIDAEVSENETIADSAASGGAAAATSITVTDAKLTENKATSSSSVARGGGVRSDGTLLVTRSFFDHNEADGSAQGGGAFNGSAGTVTITESLFWENYARGAGSAQGGALSSQGATTFQLNRSTLRDNNVLSAGGVTSGGGISTGGGTLTAFGSAIVRNYADGASGFGGGIDASGTELNIYNSTVAGNIGPDGSGIRATEALKTRFATIAGNETTTSSAQVVASSTFQAAATVVADAQGSGTSDCAIGGAVTAQTANYATDGTCGFTGPLNVPAGLDPLLGDVRDNGGPQTGPAGPLPTRSARFSAFPLQGSPLIDVMTPGQCSSSAGAVLGLEVDQRGVPRPFGDGCDIGAIESIFPAHGFSDVSNFYEPTVCWITSGVNDPNILDGFDDNTFRQAQNITRGQVVRMYYRAAGEPDVSGLPGHGFSDVTPFFADAVRWAKGSGIFDGFDDGTFRQAKPINRGNFLRSLANFAKAEGVSPDPPPHPFTDVTPFYDDAVDWAADNGLADGFDDDTFRQKLNISRGNASRITYNLAQSPPAWQGTGPFTTPESMIFRSNID